MTTNTKTIKTDGYKGGDNHHESGRDEATNSSELGNINFVLASETNESTKPYKNPCDMGYSNKYINVLNQIPPPSIILYYYELRYLNNSKIEYT